MRAYASTVSDIRDRRALKKAQTRELIRAVAHDLFEEQGFDTVTIADIARGADVAVQTVFNHFATKEDLFFDGRVDWVGAPAQAVRTRAPGVSPLTALRKNLVEITGALVGSHTCPRRRAYISTLEQSDNLRRQERDLVHEAEMRLGAALLDVWSVDAHDSEPRPADPVAIAPLVAAVWVSAIRALVVQQRPRLAAGADPEATAVEAMSLADRVLAHLAAGVELTYVSAPSSAGRAEPARRVG